MCQKSSQTKLSSLNMKTWKWNREVLKKYIYYVLMQKNVLSRNNSSSAHIQKTTDENISLFKTGFMHNAKTWVLCLIRQINLTYCSKYNIKAEKRIQYNCVLLQREIQVFNPYVFCFTDFISL